MLKDVLETVWRDAKVRCPGHVVRWSHEFGYKENTCLYYSKGKAIGDTELKRQRANQLARIRRTQLRG